MVIVAQQMQYSVHSIKTKLILDVCIVNFCVFLRRIC